MAGVLDKGQCFMTHVFGRSESQLPQKYICQAALSGNGLGGANDNSPDTQERSEGKLSRSDLKQRREE